MNATRLAPFAALLLCAACAGETVVAEQTGDIQESEPPVYPTDDPVSPYATKCDGTGHLDFALSASELHEHEGRAVWMSAVEPGLTNSVSDAPVAVFEQGEVVDGGFALSCEDSLTENYAYPSFTVVIDADDSGDCSAGDVAATFQGYGWADDQVFDLTPGQDDWVPAIWHVVEDNPSVWGESFCAYYFDDVSVSEG